MLLAAILLIVVGALVLAFLPVADNDARRLRNLGGGALIVVGVILLVVVLAGVLDTESDVDAAVMAAAVGASPRRVYGCARRGCDAVNPDYLSFGARGKSWCLGHRPLLSRLRVWWQERRRA